MKKILFVVDERTLAQTLMRYATKAGFECVQINGRDEAIQKLDEVAPDMIISNVGSVNQCANFVRKIRQKRTSEQTRIVLVSGGLAYDPAVQAMQGETGIQAIFDTGPSLTETDSSLTPERFLETIRKLLRD